MVERLLNFEQGDFVRSGLAHFGFHLRDGSYCAISHQHHYMGLLDPDGEVALTVALEPVLPGPATRP